MKIAAAVIAVGLAVSGCSSNIVDGKAYVPVPATDTTEESSCYLLEIDRELGSEEQSEYYFCVSLEEWNANEIGEEWVDANGNKK